MRFKVLKWSLVLVVMLGVIVGTASAQGPVYNPDNGHSYELVEAKVISWENANAEANAKILGRCPGHLATVTTEAEKNFLVVTFELAGWYNYWLGGFQPDDETSPNVGWQWVTGEPWEYTNWSAGEPNDFEGLEQNLTMYFDGTWNDLGPHTQYYIYGYFVEYGTGCVEIDIKPGSDPNCFNNDGHGVIPVAVLTTDTFDAAQVDPFSLSLDGMGVRVKGKSGNAGAIEDVDNDGDDDLVVQIEDLDGVYETGDTLARLTGNTYGGEKIVGLDTICIVP